MPNLNRLLTQVVKKSRPYMLNFSEILTKLGHKMKLKQMFLHFLLFSQSLGNKKYIIKNHTVCICEKILRKSVYLLSDKDFLLYQKQLLLSNKTPLFPSRQFQLQLFSIQIRNKLLLSNYYCYLSSP